MLSEISDSYNHQNPSKIFLYFIKNRAQINQRDRHGQTALYHAAEHGQTKIVEYLLSISADVLIRYFDFCLFHNVNSHEY